MRTISVEIMNGFLSCKTHLVVICETGIQTKLIFKGANDTFNEDVVMTIVNFSNARADTPLQQDFHVRSRSVLDTMITVVDGSFLYFRELFESHPQPEKMLSANRQ